MSPERSAKYSSSRRRFFYTRNGLVIAADNHQALIDAVTRA
jgi:hypothetical protein